MPEYRLAFVEWSAGWQWRLIRGRAVAVASMFFTTEEDAREDFASFAAEVQRLKASLEVKEWKTRTATPNAQTS